MQIDTHNRETGGINDLTGLKPWYLPKRDQNNMTEINQMSPLIECPCSDRILRQTISTSEILTTGDCTALIRNEAECKAAVAAMAQVSSSSTVSNSSLPEGCSVVPSTTPGTYEAIFNTASSKATCGSNAAPALSGTDLGSLLNLKVAHDGAKTATITISGPSDVWFGVGFGATQMADAPYAIIVDGNGKATERKLASHAPGDQLQTSVSVKSNEE